MAAPSTSAFISIHNMAAWMIDRFGSADGQGASTCPTLVDDGADRQLLPDRAGLGLGRGGAQDHARCATATTMSSTAQAVHLGRAARTTSMSRMVRTGEDGPKGISCLVIEKDMPGVSLRRAGEEARLAFAADRAGESSTTSACRSRTASAARARASASRWRGSTAGGSTSAPARSAARSAASTRRSPTPRSASSSASRSPISRTPSSCSPTWRPSSRRRARCSTSRRPRSPRTRPTRPASRRWPSGSRPTPASSVVDRALQLHGGYGYLQDYPIERFWRDLRVHSILEGTNQVMRMIVGAGADAAVSERHDDDVLIRVEGAVGRIRAQPAQGDPRADHRDVRGDDRRAARPGATIRAVEAVLIDHAEGARLLRRRRHPHAGARAARATAARRGAFFFDRISAQPPAVHLSQADRRVHGRDHDGRRRRHLAAVPISASRPRTRASPCPRPAIGLFPDVGGGWYLSRLPGRIGQYLALTGARLDGAECLALGLATHYLPSDALDEAEGADRRRAAGDRRRCSTQLSSAAAGRADRSRIATQIDRLFASDALEDIFAALEADGGEWARRAARDAADQVAADVQGRRCACCAEGAAMARLRRRDARMEYARRARVSCSATTSPKACAR